MESYEQQQLLALHNESAELREGIRSLHDDGQRAVTMALGVFTAALPLALQYKAYGVVLALPIPLSGVLLHVLLANTEVLVLGGYRSFLEEEFNDRIRLNVKLWDSYIAPTVLYRSAALIALWAVLVLVVLSSWAAAVWVAIIKYNIVTAAIACSLTIAFLVSLAGC